MRFSGTISAKLDAKGRVFFPSVYRRQLAAAEADFVLKRDAYQPCLVVYPREVWDREVDELARRLNRWDPRQAMLFRRFLAEAEPLTLDASGRLLIPRRLLTALGLTHEVVFVGVDDRVEVWPKTAGDLPFGPDDDYAADLAAAMGGMAAAETGAATPII